MTPKVFETTISAGERPQAYALDDMTTGTGPHILAHVKNVRMTGIEITNFYLGTSCTSL
jgi:hypothetical protein